MTHLDKELPILRNSILEMWALIRNQVWKSKTALAEFDRGLAKEVLLNEKRVDAFELKIDKDCENIFALYNPVAVDLRYVLAVLKINYNLERVGDIAEGISRFILDVKVPYNKDLIEKIRIMEMFEEVEKMLLNTEKAFEEEDSKRTRSVFALDEKLNDINFHAAKTLADFIAEHPEQVMHGLNILSMIRKLERVGDHCKNIAEEIIFYIEAKVIKHNMKKSSHK